MSTTGAPTTASKSAANTKGCPKCGTIKNSAKLSCCARGGAWFKKCGDAGDTNFDHTWVEGIHACKGFVSSFSLKSLGQASLHPNRPVAQSLNTTQLRKAAQKNIQLGSVSGVHIKNSEHCAELATIVGCAILLLISLPLQM